MGIATAFRPEYLGDRRPREAEAARQFCSVLDPAIFKGLLPTLPFVSLLALGPGLTDPLG